ncbi:MAG: dTDP-4-dehydrorhamnose reductase [Planctomycetaceae bacterium]
MRIAIFGSRGQLGAELCHRLRDEEIVALGRAHADITDAGAVAAVRAESRPDVVINAAAYNFVDRAEDEPQAAYAVNALGPRNLARWCGERDVPLLHVSSDYVFGLDAGRRTPYSEADPPGPQGAYAVSKLAGEHFVRALCRRHFVVRTCGLYGFRGSPEKGNFVETMLRLGRERDELRIVNDQVCTPTFTADLADAIAALLRTDAYGLYHAASGGAATWFDFAIEIFHLAGMHVAVTPITTAEYGAKAARPCYSVLSTNKLTETTGYEFPAWQDALAHYLEQQ